MGWWWRKQGALYFGIPRGGENAQDAINIALAGKYRIFDTSGDGDWGGSVEDIVHTITSSMTVIHLSDIPLNKAETRLLLWIDEEFNFSEVELGG